MTIFDIAELAFDRFRTRSLRFFLTVLGVSVGIAVVFFLVSLGFGLQELVIGKIVTSDSLVSLDVLPSEDVAKILALDNEQIEDFKKIEFVQDVSPLLSVPTEVSFEDLKAQTLTQAVNPSYFRYAGLKTVQGGFYDDEATNEIIVSSTVLRLFEIPEDTALDREFRLTFFFPKEESVATPESSEEESQEPGSILQFVSDADPSVNILTIPVAFRIVGVVATETNSIFVPLKTLSGLENLTYAQAKVRVGTIEEIEPVRSRLTDMGYTVRALTDTLDQLNKIFRFTQVTLAVLGTVALFIASVGMFNTMTISLLERTHEVGTLKTIGATHRDVWMIFLFESLLIGFFGGFGGLGIGFVFSWVVNIGINQLATRLGGEAVHLFSSPMWLVLTILGVAFTVGIFTGLYPARRAAHIDPLEALKRE